MTILFSYDRDTFIYGISAETRGLEEVTALLADAVYKPKFTDIEVCFKLYICDWNQCFSWLPHLPKPSYENKTNHI